MTIRDAGLLAIETALNQYLSMDAEVSQQLVDLHGKVIGFDLTGTGIQLFFVPGQNGRLQVLGQYEGQADCMIIGSPVSLLGSQFQKTEDTIFSGQIEVQGSSHLAQEFTDILKHVDIDWEEHLSSLTGDVLAHQIGNALRKSSKWLKRNFASSQMNLQEYLQEEARLTPGRLEVENFFSAVDELRDDVERLAARVQRLVNNRENSS